MDITEIKTKMEKINKDIDKANKKYKMIVNKINKMEKLI